MVVIKSLLGGVFSVFLVGVGFVCYPTIRLRGQPWGFAPGQVLDLRTAVYVATVFVVGFGMTWWLCRR